MIIYPAIELHQGRCKGNPWGKAKVGAEFSTDPVTMAHHWVAEGAEWLHVVNLDGELGITATHLQALHRPASIWIQRPGADKPEPPEVDLVRQLPVNLQQLRAIRRAVATPIQFAGGIRTLDDIQMVLELGANRVVVGQIALENPELVALAIEQWGADRIIAGIDAQDGKVTVQGRRITSQVNVVDVGYRMRAIGIKRVLYADSSSTHKAHGVNVEASAHLGDITDLYVIVNSKVNDLHELERLKAHEHYNVEGVVLDQALYEGQLALREAVALGHQPLRRRSAGIIPYRRQQGKIEFLLLFNLFFEQWQFPRGGMHAHEQEEQCARREFTEETGLPILKFHKDCRTVLEYTASIRNYEIERTIVYYLAETNTQEVQLGDEDHCEARWLSAQETWELLTETSPEQLPALDTAMAYLDIIA
ncbi:MAG: NUDIX domain-containing protein [Caldilineaceae bacterium]|nr:NUDIX domain-containing protein [Caldilineaceae bacterium]